MVKTIKTKSGIDIVTSPTIPFGSPIYFIAKKDVPAVKRNLREAEKFQRQITRSLKSVQRILKGGKA